MVLDETVSVPEFQKPPPSSATFPRMELVATDIVPLLKIPPPSLVPGLPLMVLAVTVAIPRFLIPRRLPKTLLVVTVTMPGFRVPVTRLRR